MVNAYGDREGRRPGRRPDSTVCQRCEGGEVETGSTNRVLRVGVVSERLLVTEAVLVALATHGFETASASWGSRHGEVREDEVDVLLVLCDLADPQLWMSPRLTGVAGGGVPVLVVTPSEPGVLWGAALTAGAAAVLSDATSVEGVARALDDVAADRPAMDPEERTAALTRWQAEGPGHDTLSRLGSLSPREAAVLSLLSVGHDVRSIAEELELGRGTVRTYIAAIRRKLGVNSQLGAVATISWLPGPHVPAARRPPSET